MLWEQFLLTMDILCPIIVRQYQMPSISNLITKNKCTPLCNRASNGGITFSGRRQLYTFIISLYSSCEHKEYCRMSTIISGQHNFNNCISTYSIIYEAPTTMLNSFGHETSRWPQLYGSDPKFSTT
jgi:hypothetical protein